ncbi:MAG TPA: aminotransferase class V-fold PLP-dependent enzyme [Devosia sp.]|nr:aminotransferase class V-fold PLP-dependent enzyme [Devosia sp.]
MPADLRSLLTRATDHAVRYREALSAAPGRPQISYPEARTRMRAPMPETGSDPAAVIEELVALSEPGLMPITGPRFFGWVMGGSHPAGVAADLLVSAWGQNAGYHTPTPAASAMEEIAEGWLLDVLDLPRESSIGFATGATVANATCLSAARTRTLIDVGWDPDADGLFGAPPVEVFIGADAHSSLFSSLQMIGFGYNRVTKIATDEHGRMDPRMLALSIDETEGPKIVIAQAGQINTGAFDDFATIASIAKRAGAWLHVDGAFGLWARATPTHKHLTAGIELADSWGTDGHKWLQVPYDCGFAIVKDREAHQRAMTQWSSYLPAIAAGDRVPSALVPELSRRARGTPVWAMLKTLGRKGIADLVSHHCASAALMAKRLGDERGISVRNDVVLNQVIVEFGTGTSAARKALTEAVIAEVQAAGVCFLGGAAWHGDWVMRISVSSVATTTADIETSAEAIIAAWHKVAAAAEKAA